MSLYDRTHYSDSEPGEAERTNFIVFGLTRSEIVPMTVLIRELDVENKSVLTKYCGRI